MRAAFVAFALAVMIGCGACSSVPVLHFGDGVCDADAGTPEACDDGIDNDCNGLVDCADPACTPGFACVDAVPMGWNAVALAAEAREDCPAGFGAARDVSAVRGPSGAPACGCDCGGGTACTGGLRAVFDNAATCTGIELPFVANGACQRVGGNVRVAAGTYVRATAGTAACQATAPGTVPPLADGRTCEVPRLGGGCGNGQACAPKPAGAFAVCIAKSGAAACPAGWGSELHVGSSATDTRACEACTCAAQPCTGELHVFADRECTAPASMTVTAVAAPGTCERSTNAAFTARGYTATMTGGCTMGAPGAGTGSLELTDEATVCCK